MADFVHCVTFCHVVNMLDEALAHSKLKMVYSAELLVVMTDGFKIVRIRAQIQRHIRIE